MPSPPRTPPGTPAGRRPGSGRTRGRRGRRSARSVRCHELRAKWRVVRLDREYVEDATPVVVDQHDRGVDTAPFHRCQPVHVVVVRQIAGHEREVVGRRRPRPERGGDDTVDPGRPAVPERCERRGRRRTEPVEIPDGHRVRDEQRRGVGREVDNISQKPALAEPLGFGENVRVGRVGVEPPLAPRVATRPGEQPRQPAEQPCRVGDDEIARGERCLPPPGGRVDDVLVGVDRGEVVPERLRRRRRAGADHDVGVGPRIANPLAEVGVVAADHGCRPDDPAVSNPRKRVRQDRKAGCVGERGDRLGVDAG